MARSPWTVRGGPGAATYPPAPHSATRKAPRPALSTSVGASLSSEMSRARARSKAASGRAARRAEAAATNWSIPQQTRASAWVTRRSGCGNWSNGTSVVRSRPPSSPTDPSQQHPGRRSAANRHGRQPQRWYEPRNPPPPGCPRRAASALRQPTRPHLRSKAPVHHPARCPTTRMQPTPRHHRQPSVARSAPVRSRPQGSPASRRLEPRLPAPPTTPGPGRRDAGRLGRAGCPAIRWPRSRRPRLRAGRPVIGPRPHGRRPTRSGRRARRWRAERSTSTTSSAPTHSG